MGHINHINIRVVWFSWPIIKTPRIQLAHPRQSHRAIFFTALGSKWVPSSELAGLEACFFSGKSMGIRTHWGFINNGKSMGFINKIRSQPTKRESNGDFIQTRDANTDDGWLVPLKCDMSGGFKDIFVILILGGDDIWRRRSLSDSYLHLMKTIHALPNTTANVFAL